MKKDKWVLFTSSCISLPVIDVLMKQGVLAGVVTLTTQAFSNKAPAQLADLQQLHQQLIEMDLPLAVLEDETRLVAQLDEWQAGAGLIFSFSHKFTDEALAYFNGDLFNLHASPLPQYRGPNPIYWQLRDNKSTTQITVHRVCDVLDAGDIAYQSPIAIHPFDNFQTLSWRVMESAPQVIAAFMEQWRHDQLDYHPQQGEVSFAPRVGTDTTQLAFERHSAQEFVGAARAGNPLHGGVAIELNAMVINVLQISQSDQAVYGSSPGTVLAVDKQQGLIIATKAGAIALDVIACSAGYFSGYQFAIFHQIEAGMQL